MTLPTKTNTAQQKPFFFPTLVFLLAVLPPSFIVAQNSPAAFPKPILPQIVTNAPYPSSSINYGQRQLIQQPAPGNYTLPLPFIPNPSMPLPQQHQLLMQEVEQFQRNQQQTKDSWQQDLMADETYQRWVKRAQEAAPFEKAFAHLSQLNPTDFSYTDAVYEVENACLGGQLPYENFLQGVRDRAKHVKQLLRGEGLDTTNSLTLNYGIQQLYIKDNLYYSAKSKKYLTVKALKYDFEDYLGERDYTKVLTTKLMATGKGQCHSLPQLYLMVAEQLGATAWLATAPAHYYIKFPDQNGRLLNFETTNANLVSDSWVTHSGYVTTKAIKNRTYLDTLSKSQLYAECLTDLLYAYLVKLGPDKFAEQMMQKIEQANPNNLRLAMIRSNLCRLDAMAALEQARWPKPNEIGQHPAAAKAYQAWVAANQKVEQLGFQEMPKAAYERWLQSVAKEQQKPEIKKMVQRYRQTVRTHILPKPTFINKVD